MFAALLPHAQAALDPASYGMYQLARYLGAPSNHDILGRAGGGMAAGEWAGRRAEIVGLRGKLVV